MLGNNFPKESIDSISEINYTNEEKEILGYKCVGFTFENDDIKMEGYLTNSFSAIGAIIEGMDYGLPLFLKEYDKNEKITQIISAEKVEIEVINKDLFKIN